MSLGSMSLMRDGRSPPPEKPTLLEPAVLSERTPSMKMIGSEARLSELTPRILVTPPGTELTARALDLKARHGNRERFLHTLARCDQLRRRHVDYPHDIAERAHLGVTGLTGNDELVEAQHGSGQHDRQVVRAHGGRQRLRLMPKVRDDEVHGRSRQSGQRELSSDIRPRRDGRALCAHQCVGERTARQGVIDDSAHRPRLRPRRGEREKPRQHGEGSSGVDDGSQKGSHDTWHSNPPERVRGRAAEQCLRFLARLHSATSPASLVSHRHSHGTTATRTHASRLLESRTVEWQARERCGRRRVGATPDRQFGDQR